MDILLFVQKRDFFFSLFFIIISFFHFILHLVNKKSWRCYLKFLIDWTWKCHFFLIYLQNKWFLLILKQCIKLNKHFCSIFHLLFLFRYSNQLTACRLYFHRCFLHSSKCLPSSIDDIHFVTRLSSSEIFSQSSKKRKREMQKSKS